MEKYLNKIYKKPNKNMIKQTYQNGWKVKMDIYTTKEQQKMYQVDSTHLFILHLAPDDFLKPEPRMINLRKYNHLTKL
jgi:hypothetical protein